ncbi:DUF2388 domain-containing protein [Pseudomonas rhizosphaerae]|jgi:uncharacterized protein (TIGR02448 family)|uniref:DUF2388 domain-containing protein n=1 Tax=Pseudomonas rhizosphaerae TaxID=216142 RepID=UPI002B498A11|nr:DUF2388 domain-containing protein [Pseudomonas rhizosphaerae]MEB2870472.1 DUF2388 domain-containing protein [Pseudomonas rhizosphaerae]
MRFLPLFLFAWASSAAAFDVSLQSSVITLYVTSQVTTAPFDRKLILSARDDAACFVASGGQYRGARLEAAMASIRREHPKIGAGDLELAQAILVQ